MSETPFLTRCAILSELWLKHRDDEEFDDFIKYADLGIPMAYFINSGIVDVTDKGFEFVTEAWDLLLAGFDLSDSGFENLDDLLDKTEEEPYE